MKTAMDQYHIRDDGTSESIDGFFFGFQAQKKLLLSKLPSDFVTLYDLWKQCHKEADCLKGLYKNLSTVSEEYDGNWKSGKKARKSPFDQEVEKLQEEHFRRQTRSSSKQ